MKNKEDIKKELEQIGPTLSNLNTRHDFEVNEDYFEELEQNILNQTIYSHQQQPDIRKERYLMSYLKPVLAVAAMVAIALLIYFPIKNASRNNQTLESYLIDNIDAYTLSEYVARNMAADESEWENEILNQISTEILMDEL